MFDFRILHRVPELIADHQLALYLKTYDNVNSVIHNMSPIPNNWNTWCEERYGYNSSS